MQHLFLAATFMDHFVLEYDSDKCFFCGMVCNQMSFDCNYLYFLTALNLFLFTRLIQVQQLRIDRSPLPLIHRRQFRWGRVPTSFRQDSFCTPHKKLKDELLWIITRHFSML